MLTLIRSLHTLIWVVVASCIFYVGYAVLRMEFPVLFYVALSLVALEVLVILVNAWVCPLTSVARRYSASTEPNFDIYLPRWLARYNKEIFSVILFVILLLYIYNTVR